MTTALLVCDHVLPQFRAQHGDYPTMFATLFPDFKMVPRFVCDGDFPDIDDFDQYVISGSKYSVYQDVPWIDDLKQFTFRAFETGKRTLGVCFGHQMMAEALGGKVEKAEDGFMIGLHDFDVIHRESWMADGLEKRYRMLMLCQDQVIGLPADSKVLSTHSDCPVAMMSVGDHFLGIQGHPEFTCEYNQAVFESRTEKIGLQKIGNAIRSFEKKPDTSVLGESLSNFLRGG